MSRLAALVACCALLAAPCALAANLGSDGTGGVGGQKKGSVVPPKSWDTREIRLVVQRGLMARTVGAFRPNDTLTRGELAQLVADLTKQAPRRPPDPAKPVTVTQLDASLVRRSSSRMQPYSSSLLRVTRASGSRLASAPETVARLLGLRTNHPAKDDDLELLPSDPVTRAETAYSVATILRFRGWEQQSVEAAAATFALPDARRLAEARARHRGSLRRLPVRLGRHERETGGALRRQGARRLRLLGLRLARLQASVVRGRRRPRTRPSRAARPTR